MISHKIENFFYVPPGNKNGGFKKVISSYVMPRLNLCYFSSNLRYTYNRHRALQYRYPTQG